MTDARRLRRWLVTGLATLAACSGCSHLPLPRLSRAAKVAVKWEPVLAYGYVVMKTWVPAHLEPRVVRGQVEVESVPDRYTLALMFDAAGTMQLGVDAVGYSLFDPWDRIYVTCEVSDEPAPRLRGVELHKPKHRDEDDRHGDDGIRPARRGA